MYGPLEGTAMLNQLNVTAQTRIIDESERAEPPTRPNESAMMVVKW
jgi:hypothetical protein